MNPFFSKAEKIWLSGLCDEHNIQAGFLCELPSQGSLELRITGSTLYRIFWNGCFLQYGPARAPHGHCRVDLIKIPPLPDRQSEKAVLAIEVAGYNCESYYTLRKTSFLQAEVIGKAGIIASTGDENFIGIRIKSRYQRVLRYSYQRNFMEAYGLTKEDAEAPWYDRIPTVGESTETLNFNIRYLERGVPPASLTTRGCSNIIESGRFELNREKRIISKDYPSYISLDYDGIKLTGFPVSQLAFPFHEIVSSMVQRETIGFTNHLSTGDYSLFEFPINNNGFIKISVKAHKSSRLLLIFDEKLIEGRIKRNCRPTINFIVLDLEACPRKYSFTSFETYGFKYLEVALIEGEVEFTNPELIEYGTSDWENCRVSISDDRLQKIFDASLQTYRQNTLDVFMDCPTRERAGWLCDSYYTGQSSQLFSGKTDVEKTMLENYVLRDPDPVIPPQVMVMCYPADHINGRFIPQWAMWYIVELDDYLKRNPKAGKEEFRKITLDFIEWCERFENEFGLLEDLPSWNFVEWSKANDWVSGVNYPSNMLYSRILKIAGRLFGKKELLDKAVSIDENIINFSWDGHFFIDQSVRNEKNELCPTRNISEVCQYSAYAHGVIERGDKDFSTLWDNILHLFGPGRKENEIRPDITYANAFIGNYLRMEILLDAGEYARILSESEDYFLKMAEKTGTLWEHDNIKTGSLNHGFASFIGLVIVRCLGGVQAIDNRRKTVTIDIDPNILVEMDLEWKTPWGSIEVNRKIINETARITLTIPEKYRMIIHQRSRKYIYNRSINDRGSYSITF